MFNWLIVKGIVPHVVIVLFAAAVTGGVGWGITKLKLDYKETQLENQILRNENDRKAYAKAQAEAEAKAQEVARKKEQQYAEIKAEQDAAYSKLLNQYRVTLVRYKAEVAKRPTGGSNLPPTPGTAPGVEGEGGDSLIPVPEDDLRICAVNTAKAQIAHEWVTELQKQK